MYNQYYYKIQKKALFMTIHNFFKDLINIQYIIFYVLL